MEELNTPQGQDNTAERSNNRQNSSPAIANVSTVTPTDPSSPCKHTEAAKCENSPPWWKKLDVYRFLAELAILAITVRIACIYSDQLSQMIESNRINRDALQSVQRAFISFSPRMNIGTTIKNNRIVAFHPQVPISNSGATPTKNMHDYVSVYPGKDAITKDFKFTDIGRTGGPEAIFIGPHDTIWYYANPIDIRDAQAAQSHSGHVYVYGWATYNDRFEGTPQHITMFCYELRFDPSIDISDPRWTQDHSYNVGSFGMCPSEVGHNCADEECAK
jgi:hypothetical protein